jgi:hypothetical protein
VREVSFARAKVEQTKILATIMATPKTEQLMVFIFFSISDEVCKVSPMSGIMPCSFPTKA